MMLKLAILGGGPSAVCVLEAVACHIAPEAQVSVTVYDPGTNLWRGRVFQPDGDEVLANVPMVAMSARVWDPEHGVQWLRDRGMSELAADDLFPPRQLVGGYLEAAAEQTIAALRSAGAHVQVERHAVRALSMREGLLHAQGDGREFGPFDHAVLCLGSSPSYDHYGLSGIEGYVGDPYPLRESMRQVPTHARVGIIGSGLTAVDVVIALRARGHQGPITLISRNGYLPAVRRRPARHDLLHLTVPRLEALASANGALRLADLLGLVKAELAEAGADTRTLSEELASTAPAVQRLRDDIESSRQSHDPGWTVLRDALVACGQDAWYLLRQEDKDRVRARHQTLMRNCCPMPPCNAELLLDMFDSGQLDVLPGIHSILSRPGRGFQIHAKRDIDVDVVVEASTPAKHLPPPVARPLLASLRSQGLAVPNPFGGVHVDRTTSRLVNAHGEPDPRLYALGDITHGAYLFTFGMPVLAARANHIITDIKEGIASANVLVEHR